ncbi:unsaturated rhamnogalacturonyl hydrolase [Granulicella pectinivorans]|jgi:unsaturated rhamnogalacturonyl hydrolase|uniref:Unsaturated rhamnogalacturonyl hydrolase n=1 Tax=Granulicella pectinivorans TaxID=474950 RepID=A0A1I6MTJ4_9BACT|nr:unsaturated rhamnogalacturonyl hydrolase [Granulicella pectinivorans]
MTHTIFYLRPVARRWLLPLVLSGAFSAAVAQQASVADADRSLPNDLSVGVVEQTMKAHPVLASLGKWNYTRALTLYAIEKVYERTHDLRYLHYVQGWADAHVSAKGEIDEPLVDLDNMLPGILMLSLYRDTGEERYRIAAQTIRRRFDTYPRTKDGGLWHGAGVEHTHQLWLDGMFMSMPFLVQYGEMFGDQKYAYREASKQLLLYASHLNDPKTGLLFHAYDELGTEPWAQPVTHHSSFFWGRSIGWYGVALVEVLETMPKNDPDRPKLMALVRQLAAAFERYQDPHTGLWFNVVDKADEPGNWLETSASSMFIYMLSKGVERGYIEPKYAGIACKGYRGMLTKLIANPEGRVSVTAICAGTVVGDLAYYLKRPANTDDLHGIGAFMLMSEQMKNTPCARTNASR